MLSPAAIKNTKLLVECSMSCTLNVEFCQPGKHAACSILRYGTIQFMSNPCFKAFGVIDGSCNRKCRLAIDFVIEKSMEIHDSWSGELRRGFCTDKERG
jgi:hypothetical protein